MSPQITSTAAMTDQACAAIEDLVLDGCHALDAYLDHPCEVHAEELVHLQGALLAAVGGVQQELCDDVLAVAAEIELALTAVTASLSARGAA